MTNKLGRIDIQFSVELPASGDIEVRGSGCWEPDGRPDIRMQRTRPTAITMAVGTDEHTALLSVIGTITDAIKAAFTADGIETVEGKLGS